MEQRRPIVITIKLLLFAAACLAGLAFCTMGIRAWYKEGHAQTFEEMSVGNCRAGNYIADDIETYLVSISHTEVTTTESGVNRTHLAGVREYDFYTVPTGDGHYIQIAVFRRETKDALECYVHGQSGEEPVWFTGEIIKSPVELNVEWYEAVPQLADKRGDEVIEEYVVRETDFANKKKVLYLGIMCFGIAALFFIWMKIERRESRSNG
ncbi:MAG: hypothetical protein K2N41_00800 [Lachnospiraceae bacterium]|nr:hypothetical protein [Lachnospiraceae bacterium]MDE7238235.1 hypothetical protein [Lachnospiraceae bacterium]